MQLSDIDIYNPDNYTKAPPYEMFAYLREHAPLYKHPHPDGGYFWVVSRYQDVATVSRDHKAFSAQTGFVLIDNLPKELLEQTQHQLLGMDPPNHGPIRRMVIDRFTTRMIDAMEIKIRDMVCEIMQRAADMKTVDFVNDMCAPLPTNIICDLMGIPEKDWEQIRHWADKQTSADDPDIVASPEEAQEASIAMGTYGYQIASEQKNLQDDPQNLMQMLLGAEVDGKPVDAMQFASLFIQITVAGNETTRNLLAYGMMLLLDNPDYYEKLKNNKESIPLAVDEMLRYICPLHYFRRTATCDTTINDITIAEGDRVMMSYVSANRDQAQFQNADNFDMGRKNNRSHLSFGHGIHLCLGAHLARMEAKIFFEEWFKRFRTIELNGTPQRIRSNLINGLKTMPVTLKVA